MTPKKKPNCYGVGYEKCGMFGTVFCPFRIQCGAVFREHKKFLTFKEQCAFYDTIKILLSKEDKNGSA